jgi:hypothetical protein
VQRGGKRIDHKSAAGRVGAERLSMTAAGGEEDQSVGGDDFGVAVWVR